MVCELGILFQCGLAKIVINGVVLDNGIVTTTPGCGLAIATAPKSEMRWSWLVTANLISLA